MVLINYLLYEIISWSVVVRIFSFCKLFEQHTRIPTKYKHASRYLLHLDGFSLNKCCFHPEKAEACWQERYHCQKLLMSRFCGDFGCELGVSQPLVHQNHQNLYGIHIEVNSQNMCRREFETIVTVFVLEDNESVVA